MDNTHKSPTFTLIVDEERATILNLLISYILEDGLVTPDFQDACETFGVSFEGLNALSNEVNSKTHEHDWCHAPECTYHDDNE